jgi:hypothetical protein
VEDEQRLNFVEFSMVESPIQTDPKPNRLRSFFTGHRYRQWIAGILVAAPLVTAAVPTGFTIFDRFHPPVAPALAPLLSPGVDDRVARLEGQMDALLATLNQTSPATPPEMIPDEVSVMNTSSYEGRIGGIGRQEWN